MTNLRNTVRNTLFASALAAGLAAPIVVQAQEILGREESMKLALAATLQAPAQTDAPIQVDVDLKRPLAGHDGDYGLLILPETKLTAATLEAAGQKPVPLAQLWLRKLTPMCDGSPVDSTRLRMVSVWHDGESHRVPLCLVGARKTESGSLELLVYGKGTEPLVKLPLRKVERTQMLPIEIAVERDSESGRITLQIAGRYEATLQVTELMD